MERNETVATSGTFEGQCSRCSPVSPSGPLPLTRVRCFYIRCSTTAANFSGSPRPSPGRAERPHRALTAAAAAAAAAVSGSPTGTTFPREPPRAGLGRGAAEVGAPIVTDDAATLMAPEAGTGNAGERGENTAGASRDAQNSRGTRVRLNGSFCVCLAVFRGIAPVNTAPYCMEWSVNKLLYIVRG